MARLLLLLLSVFSPALALVLKAGSEFTGQFNDPATSSEHPTMRIHLNGTLLNLPSYEPAGIEPNLDSIGPVTGQLVHHVDETGAPDLACTERAGLNYTGKIVLVKRGECNFVLKIRNIQKASAAAVVVYDNVYERWISMGFDGTQQPEIPSVFIQKQEADWILAVMDNTNLTQTVNGFHTTLLPDNEDSLRFVVTSSTLLQSEPGIEHVEGTVDARRTVDGHMGTDYMKFKVSGTYDTVAGKLSVSPVEWVTKPSESAEAIGWFGLDGTLLPEGHAMSGKTLPMERQFHLRIADPGECPGRVANVQKCQATGANAFCGEGCLEVTDANGYRLFNDDQCAFTEPLMWYCNILTSEKDENSENKPAYACAGQRLMLTFPIVSEPSTCPAGQKHNYPFFEEWPAGYSSRTFGHHDWRGMTSDSLHGSFSTYFCANKSQCTRDSGRDTSLGWRLRGGFADSGVDKLPNSKSVLEYQLTVAANAQIHFTYISDGEPSFDYLEFEVCKRTSNEEEDCIGKFKHDDTRVRYSDAHEWRTTRYTLADAGDYYLRWNYVKDWNQDQGRDEARLLELAVTGFSDDQLCHSCPRDHCSIGGRFDGCQACPSKTFSAPGAASCTVCTDPKPANAHYSMPSEHQARCQTVCDPGYTLSDSGGCVPESQTCLLPKENSFNGKFDPPSWAMLDQCLLLRHRTSFVQPLNNSAPSQPFCQSAVKTVHSIQAAKALDARADRREAFYNEIDKMAESFQRETRLWCTNWQTDYDFHQDILGMLRGNPITDKPTHTTSSIQPDAEYIYAPPVFYQNLYTYLPIKFNYTHEGGRYRLFSDTVSQLAGVYGYQNSGDLESSLAETFGWEVIAIDDQPAHDKIVNFANSEVGFSSDQSTRVDLAVRGDYPSLWACSFAVRTLGMCRKPPAETVVLKMQSPDGKVRDVTLKWTIIYFGDDCGDADDAGCPDAHVPKFESWLDCDKYSNFRGAEQGHFVMANDDTGDDNLGVQLHHKWFDHKDLMLTENLKSTSHMTHQYNAMALTVMDSYEHVAAYAHTDTDGTKTGILRVASFHGEAAEFHAVLMEVAALNPARIVIDLRTNGGGHVCHALQLAYLLSDKYSTKEAAVASFDFRKTRLMEVYAFNQSLFMEAHPEFALAPRNFMNSEGIPYIDSLWYSEKNAASPTYTQTVSMNCDRYSSLLEYYSWDGLQRTRKMLNGYDQDRIQVLVDAQCVGACALFARMAVQDGFGKVVGVGTGTIGTAPSGISMDLDGLYCQWKGMKQNESSKVPVMPYKGQNLVFPLTRLHKWSGRRDDDPSMPQVVEPTITLPAGTYRPDSKQGTWYSGMQLYCASIAKFDPSTADFKPGCPHCTEECSSMSAGWAFFWIFFGILLVPCLGGLGYYFNRHGCSADSVCGLCAAVKEMFMRTCGSRWERSYGSLSGDPSDGMPSQGCCQGFDWRSYVPGMKGSALEDQYSGMQTGGGEMVGHSNIDTDVSEYADYGPAFTSDTSSRTKVDELEQEEKTANL